MRFFISHISIYAENTRSNFHLTLLSAFHCSLYATHSVNSSEPITFFPPPNIKTILIPHIDTTNMALNISWSYFVYELSTVRICSLDNMPIHILVITTLYSFPLFINYIVAFNSLFFSCRFYVMALKN